MLTEPGKPPLIPRSAVHGQTSGRRLALARWLTEPDTPASGLVARVMVNRIWQQLFGEGIVIAAGQLRPQRRAAHPSRSCSTGSRPNLSATAGISSR